jgi:hypothetical protein
MYVENFTIDKIHHLEKKINYFFKKRPAELSAGLKKQLFICFTGSL